MANDEKVLQEMPKLSIFDETVLSNSDNIDFIDEENDDHDIKKCIQKYLNIINKTNSLITRQQYLKSERAAGRIECKIIQNCLAQVYGRLYETSGFIIKFHTRDPIVFIVTVNQYIFINIDTQEILYMENQLSESWNANHIVTNGDNDLIVAKQDYGLFLIDFNCDPKEVYDVQSQTAWAFLHVRVSDDIIVHTARPGSHTCLYVHKRTKDMEKNLYKSVESGYAFEQKQKNIKGNRRYYDKFQRGSILGENNDKKYTIVAQAGAAVTLKIQSIKKIEKKPFLMLEDGYNGFSTLKIIDKNKIQYENSKGEIKIINV